MSHVNSDDAVDMIIISTGHSMFTGPTLHLGLGQPAAMQSYMLLPPALRSVMVMRPDKPQIRACHQRASSGRQQPQLEQVLAVTCFPAWSLGKLAGAPADLLQHST